MAAHFTENTPEAAALRLLFKDDPEYSGRVKALERAAGQRPDRINDSELAKKLFNENTVLSPSQIEKFHNCAFEYFCQYGLGAKERRPAEVDVMQYGTLMHYIFESVFRRDAKELRVVPENELLSEIKSLITEYAENNMGGLELLSGREKYRLNRMALSACKLVRHIAEELSQSEFKPKHFEYRLAYDSDCPPLKIADGKGGTVTVGGTVDRVDVVEIGGKEYVRVIDYKTGSKDFQLIDVLYGLNMQMLVYLAALVESGQHFPAGLLYMPAAEPTVTVERGADESEIKSAAEKKLRMKGVVLDNSDIICAMEAGAKGRFIPAVLNKDGTVRKSSSVLDEKSLALVMEHSKRLIATMAQKLRQGDVAAKPNMINRNACAYCPYGAVCGKEFDDKDIEKVTASTADILAEMSGTEGGEENA